MPEHVPDASRAFAERTEQTLADRIVVRDRARAYARRERSIDILEVHVTHARSGVARDLQRVGATQCDVARVETERVRRALEESFDLVAALDRRPPVRMHGHAKPVRVRYLDHAVYAVEKRGPGGVPDLGGSGVARLRERRREDEDLSAARGEPLRLALHGGERLRPASALVQDRGDEATDEA